MKKSKDRITVRLSESDLKGLYKVQSSGDFSEMSEAVRWCIHFSIAIMKLIPVAVVNSFVGIEDTRVLEEKHDSLEDTTKEIHKPYPRCQNEKM